MKFFLECAQCGKFNHDGSLIAVAAEDSTAKIIDFASGKVIYKKPTVDNSKHYFP